MSSSECCDAARSPRLSSLTRSCKDFSESLHGDSFYHYERQPERRDSSSGRKERPSLGLSELCRAARLRQIRASPPRRTRGFRERKDVVSAREDVCKWRFPLDVFAFNRSRVCVLVIQPRVCLRVRVCAYMCVCISCVCARL